MKKLFLLCVASILFSAALFAQDYNRSLEGIEWIKIQSESPISVKGHNKDQLIIKADKAEAKPERAKGLKLINNSGEDNTGHEITITREGNILKVTNLRKLHDPEIELLVPSHINLSINSLNLADIKVGNISGEIEATAGHVANITLNDITGPVTASSMAGDIFLDFKQVNQKSPISVTTSTGAIDITMPKDTKANILTASTIGNIYTDFDIKTAEKEGLKPLSRRRIQGTINNGGVKIILTSSAGDIFIRQH